jgi:phage terminase large subunit-like protein
VKAADASSGAAGQKENRIRQIEITDEIYARRGGKEWPVKGRIAQVAPEEVVLKHVDVWLMIGGRGSGKTRAGAEWVNAIANGYMPYARGHKGQIALIGETLADVRDVMIEGPAGILATGRNGKPRFESSRRRVVWETGMTALVFSSEDPESLRGPQFGAAWCDEIGKWKNGDATWDMLQFGLRLGARPQLLATTTPRATQLIKRLMADPAAYVTRVKTLENADNLAPGFLDRLIKRYGGTRLARQELDGELIEDCDDALWKRGALEGLRGAVPEDLRRIVVAVDPPTTSGKQADACGIVAAGLTGDGMVHVLADASIKRAAPAVWAAAAVRLFKELQADCILAEVNQGGEMVENVIRTVDKDVPVRTARASRGKWLRAEPVAALYEQGKVRHAGRFAELEDEMCNFGRDGLAGGRSPDRVDALVWAVSELVFGEKDKPRVRSL